jgi:outer membrane beta-barrel protein
VLRPKWGLAVAAFVLACGGGIARAQTAPGAELPPKPVSPSTNTALEAGAAAADTPAPAKPSDAPLPSCLDQTIAGELGETLKPRGVQKKNFLKRYRFNLVAHGGEYGGDLTSSTWIAGAALGFFVTEDLGFQGEFDLTPLTLDLDAPLNQFFGDNRFKAGMAKVVLGNVLWAPIHAKMKLGGGIVHTDIMFFIGGGRMFQDAVQGLSFDAGAAIDFFVSNYFTIRIDTRDLTAIEEIAGDTRFTHNIIATLGLSMWFPAL